MKRAPYVATVERFGELNTPAPVMVPTWFDAAQAVDSGKPTALDSFVCRNAPLRNEDAWRVDLAAVIAEAKK